MSRARGGRVTRKWEVFAGRNRFWCGGRLMTAPRPGVLGATLALVGGTSALHLALDGPVLWARVSPALPAAAAALCALTLAALLRTALSDPGIVPRAPPHERAAPPLRPPPRAREVLVRGRPVKLKYCFTCNVFRPPRASHCSLCDNCVERFDHHCPWVGNCVGRRNYRHFYTFVVSLAFLAVWVCGCAVARVALEARSLGAAGALRAAPHAALVAAVCFLSVWSVLGLAGFHTYLAATDQTTNEDIKGAWSARRGLPNPYSRGSACANCCHVLCGPIAPSLIDRRGPVVDPRDELPPALRAALAAAPPAPETHPLEAVVTCPTSGSWAYTNNSLEPDGPGVPLPMGTLSREPLRSPGHNEPSLQSSGHSIPSAGHSIPSPGHSIPSPGHSIPNSGHSIPSPGHSSQSRGNSLQSPGHSLQSPGHSLQSPGHAVPLSVLSSPNHSLLSSGNSAPTSLSLAGAGGHASLLGGELSASRLRLLTATTMIDAALDLDEPEPPRHLPPLPLRAL